MDKKAKEVITDDIAFLNINTELKKEIDQLRYTLYLQTEKNMDLECKNKYLKHVTDEYLEENKKLNDENNYLKKKLKFTFDLLRSFKLYIEDLLSEKD